MTRWRDSGTTEPRTWCGPGHNGGTTGLQSRGRGVGRDTMTGQRDYIAVDEASAGDLSNENCLPGVGDNR